MALEKETEFRRRKCGATQTRPRLRQRRLGEDKELKAVEREGGRRWKVEGSKKCGQWKQTEGATKAAGGCAVDTGEREGKNCRRRHKLEEGGLKKSLLCF